MIAPGWPATATIIPPWLPQTAVLESVTPETPGVATYRLRPAGAQHEASYSFEPGQFNMLYVPGYGEAAISLSGPTRLAAQGSADAELLVHTIREVGSVTGAIARLTVGQKLAFRGPFGVPWPLEELTGKDVVLVAGGIGLAPLRPVIYSLLSQRNNFGRCILLIGARSPQNLLYAPQYSAWTSAGLEIQMTVDRPPASWQGNVGAVPLLVDRLRLTHTSRTTMLMCGPEVMMRFCAAGALARGLSPQRIWLSLERHMQCAVGLCGHCQLGTELLCRDGPVFRYDRVEPLLQIHDL